VCVVERKVERTEEIAVAFVLIELLSTYEEQLTVETKIAVSAVTGKIATNDNLEGIPV
jgi:hypothetical protein